MIHTVSTSAEFGTTVRTQREKLKKSQEWLARQVGYPTRTVAELEAGRNIPHGIALAAMAALGLLLTAREPSDPDARPSQKVGDQADSDAP